ncbi:MAG: DNA polymerase III [Treponema sp.]|nr:DNA polymerase III [Treponema sp.]
MFENLVGQEAGKALISDIKNARFPGAVLYSGSQSSGKLTAALETYRVFSCTNTAHKGSWQCTCFHCMQSKSLISSNMMLLGPRDCALEIAAAQKTFLLAAQTSASYLTAARYLYIRSIRKLTLRFNPILWKGDSNLNKIGVIIESINEELEKIDFPRQTLPPMEELRKITDNLLKETQKLENEFLYDSIPISQIRNMEEWAHLKSEEGKKTIIIENADRMLEGVRNALLKILEEPPADCVFILLTSRRNAMMQTILSRVRTYNFKERSADNQNEVISRVFHEADFKGSINDYLLTFLPIPPSKIKILADDFCNSVSLRRIIDCNSIAKENDNFSPRIELRLFLHFIALHYRKLLYSPAGAEAGAQIMGLLRTCYDNVISYNQSPGAALEVLFRDLSAVNVSNGGILTNA